MISLPSVTLVCVDCLDTGRAISAMDTCKNFCSFGDALFFTSLPTLYPHKVEIAPITCRDYYSEFILTKLYAYITTPHMMIVQYDGYILNPHLWEDAFLAYDYIGAPWENDHNGITVGNGGFSIRSKALMQYVAENPVHHTRYHNEDYVICVDGGERLKKAGFTFAPEALSGRFSFERNERYNILTTFGFHGFYALEKIKAKKAL